jgi:O-succinylbenzoic acid--CoA ligase
MTETAAMVTAVLPEEFLRGDRSSGRALPHARVTVGTDGAIAVSGESLSRGYFPNRVEERTFVTGDLGQMDGDGRLRVLGRRDGVIITGGEKVLPDEVEAILRGTGEFSAVAVIGLPHPDWGQEVVAVHGPGPAPDLAKVQRALNEALGRFKHPKRYWSVPVWPTSDNGKLRRGELIQLLDNRASRST